MAGAGTLLVTPDSSGTTINTLPAPGQDTMAGSLPVAIASNQSTIPVRTTGSGVGALAATPTASTNGTALGTMPAAAKGARLYVQPGGSITFTIAATAPSAAPTGLTITVANPSANTVPTNWDEDLTGGQMIYVTAGSGLFRWY
ncbi:hypothetical protein MKK88_05745 [Methylobacterium sp. E-005]|uniref:hypothetical protein n=1 Tax=Methylobacterium sp. E-005 TaxID=2836549 RepID=UPI001FB9DA79|nr:hypothetical protein [Methylobacterium sp. E-005]MCJ2085497.1 hypothetical protein [Methylobacterium sp. E-005]